MKFKPSEFDEFFGLINTTANRRLKAKQKYETGYVIGHQDMKPKSGKYKPKAAKSKSNPSKPKTERDLKWEEYQRKLQQRKNESSGSL
jgi:hypothetical protein